MDITAIFRRHTIALALLLVGILLSFTPIYTIGIALIVTILALSFPIASSGVFRPLSTRLITLFLIFVAWVMTLATYGWLAKVTLPAVVFLGSFILIYLIAWYKLSPKDRGAHTPTRLSSGIALALSLTGIAVLLGSFYIPQPTVASSVQIITNGYDNTAHLSLIRTTYNEGGYVYGSLDETKDRIAWSTLTAYPQGWHFANAFLWKGTGIPAFTGASVTPEIVLYITTLLGWYTVAVFLFHQLLLYTLRASSLLKKWDILSIITFTGLSLFIQLLVFWGSLSFGFGTFICALAYLFLFVAVILHTHQEKSVRKNFNSLLLMPALALLCIAAIAQGWLFAVPIVTVSMLLGLFFIFPIVFKKFRASKYTIFSLFAAYIIIGVPVIVQFVINLKYSIQGGNQINDDGGIFGISTTLAVWLIIGGLVALSSKLIKDRALRSALASISLPALGFIGILLLYQLFTIGHTAYFFTKALALTLCLVWLPLSCLVFALVGRLRENTSPLYAAGIVTIGFLLLPFMFGQDISSFTKLLQQKSNLTTESAEKIAKIVEDETPKQYRTFVLTGQKYDGDVIGTIFTITLASPPGSTRSQCDGDALWVIISRRNKEFPDYANTCAETAKLQVVTSNNLDPSIIERLNENIRIVK